MGKYFFSVLLIFFFLLPGCRVIEEATPVPPTVTSTVAIPPTQTPTPKPAEEAAPLPVEDGILQPETGDETLMPVAPVELARRPFVVLADAPIETVAFLHADKGCNWMGAAGQVFGINGEPLPGIIVVVTGNVAGTPVDVIGFTGSATGYGPGGYEIQFSNRVAPGIFWIQIFDLAGTPLSEVFFFQLAGDCQRNLAIINFRQQEGAYQLGLPFIQR